LLFGSGQFVIGWTGVGQGFEHFDNRLGQTVGVFWVGRRCGKNLTQAVNTLPCCSHSISRFSLQY